MKRIITRLACAAFCGLGFAAIAHADDIAAPKTTSDGHFSSKVDQQINQAVDAGSTPESDAESRIRDLDETRTAIDQKHPSSISLGVSGWVSQEIQYNKP